MRGRFYIENWIDILKRKIVFCFSHAGGSADFFNLLEQAAPDIDFIKLEYPGHGKRLNESLCDSIREVVEKLYPIIVDIYKTKSISHSAEYGLLGYSMGSIAAFDMARYISERKEIDLPKHIFLAAHAPIARVSMNDISKSDIDEYVRQRTIEFNAVPQGLIENRAFWRVYLPIYKADYLMISGYTFEACEDISNIPTSIFFSGEDTAKEDIVKWDNYFSTTEYYEYSGSHFFICDNYKKMAHIIAKKMETQ